MKNINISVFYLTIIFTSLSANAYETTTREILKNYSSIAYSNYKDTYQDGLALQKAVNLFLDNPNKQTLQRTKQAWLMSRETYGQTEAFRFYDGPIDFVDSEKGIEGPEARLNAWPVNEAY